MKRGEDASSVLFCFRLLVFFVLTLLWGLMKAVVEVADAATERRNNFIVHVVFLTGIKDIMIMSSALIFCRVCGRLDWF